MTRAFWVVLTAAAVCACERPMQLLDETAFVGDAIPASLTLAPGEAARGRQIFVDREGGHCVLCHVVAELDAPFQGDLGPDLTRVADRLSPGQIRLQIVDAARLNPETLMPSYYRIDALHQVEHGAQGRPVLSSNDVEDLVAYLSTLKETGG